MAKTKRTFALTLSAVLALSTVSAGCSWNKKSEPSSSPTGTQASGSSTSSSPAGGTDNPAANYPELKIKMLGSLPTGNKATVEDVLTPIWREKTKVVPEIVTIPTGQDNVQWVQMQSVANTLPDILTANGILDNSQTFELLKKNNALRTITLEEMKQNMPLLAKRAEKYGVSLDQIFQDNVNPDGKLYYIPGGFDVAAAEYTRNSRMGDENIGATPNMQYVRDDILKQIFPNAKTEAELAALYKKNGKLTYDDVNDIPIKSLADFHDFLVKVKQLNLKVDGKPVIPAHPSLNSDVGSLMWSTMTMSGFWWQFGSFAWKNDQLVYVQGTPEWKEYIRWYNQAYNEGLLDKEQFIQKDDQRNAKVINGEYATFQMWEPVNDARKLAKEKGRTYGYRMIPVFADMPLENKNQTFQYAGTNLKAPMGGVGITKSVKEENIPQILHWIDWNMSEEADQLRYWGPEGKFYTGEGADRRFKPEYKELEDWLVRGKKGEKDGAYYGLYESPFRGNDFSAWNHETFGIRSFQFPDQPYYIYPVDTNGEVNIDNIVWQAMRKHYKDQQVFYHRDIHEDFAFMVDPDGKWSELSKTNAWDSEAGKTAIVGAIVGKTQDFDKNYAAYEKTFSPEYKQVLQSMADNWKKVFAQYTKPAIDAAKK